MLFTVRLESEGYEMAEVQVSSPYGQEVTGEAVAKAVATMFDKWALHPGDEIIVKMVGV